MSTYVLVHGSWHAAWCWYKIVPRLEKAGHRAIAIDLPGHGRDGTPVGDVTMQQYVKAIGSALDTLEEPAILVAHSRGGHRNYASCRGARGANPAAGVSCGVPCPKR